MTNIMKTTLVAGAMALTFAAVPGTADARGWGGGGFHVGFHGGGFRGGWGGRGFGYRGGWGGRGFGWRGGYRRGFGWRGGYGRGWGYPFYGYGCGPYRRFYGGCRYYW